MAAKKSAPVREKLASKGKKSVAIIANTKAKAPPSARKAALKPAKAPPAKAKASLKKTNAKSLEAGATVLVGAEVMPEIIEAARSLDSSKRKGKNKRAAAPEPAVAPTPAAEVLPHKRKKKNAKLLEAEATVLVGAEARRELKETPPESAAESTPKRKRRKKNEPAEAAPLDAPVSTDPSIARVPDAEKQAELADTKPSEETEPGEEKEPGKIEAKPEEIMRTIEALLFAAEEPIAVREIARAAGSDSPTVRKLLPRLIEAYEKQRRPWTILEIGEGYRLMTRPEFFPAIQRLKTQTAQRRLTQPALETLALIAYRQPIGRADVESVRGVGAGPVIRILLEKKLIKISGRGTGLGQPLLYGTTDYFLEHFGLKSIADLPKPGEFKGS